MLVSNSKVIKGNKIGDTDTFFFFLRVHDRDIFFSDLKKGKKCLQDECQMLSIELVNFKSLMESR